MVYLHTPSHRREEIRQMKVDRYHKHIDDVSASLWNMLKEYTTQCSKGSNRVHEVNEEIIHNAIESFIKNSDYVVIPKKSDPGVIYEMEGLTDLIHWNEDSTREEAREEMNIAYSVLAGHYDGSED